MQNTAIVLINISCCSLYTRDESMRKEQKQREKKERGEYARGSEDKRRDAK
jgi:hypothetical protein